MISIAAVSQNGFIGYKGGLPWPKIKEDLAFFKSITLERHYLVVGRTTFDTLPKLKDRKLLIVTSHPETLPADKKNSLGGEFYDVIAPEDVHQLRNLGHCCIGGGKLYSLALPFCKDFFLSIIRSDHEGDTRLCEFKSMFDAKCQLLSSPNLEIIHYVRNTEI